MTDQGELVQPAAHAQVGALDNRVVWGECKLAGRGLEKIMLEVQSHRVHVQVIEQSGLELSVEMGRCREE
jgi:hypothetical protein